MKKSETAKPEKVTYEQWKDEQIRRGLADLEAGRVLSHEEVMRRSEAQLRRLEKKNTRAA